MPYTASDHSGFFVGKRVFDIVFALCWLLLLSPLLLLISILVRLDSRGPAFFLQPRLGRAGQVFNIYKFRKFPHQLAGQGPAVTVANDIRMTRLGRFLESSKLDELPQLFNILKGDMSFVGPRPETLNFAHLFTGKFEQVLAYVPGLFGPNQLRYRHETSLYPPGVNHEAFYRDHLFPEKAENDLAYFKNATLGTDLRLIVQGVWKTLTGYVKGIRILPNLLLLILYDFSSVLLAWALANVIRYQHTGRFDPTYFVDIVLWLPAVFLITIVLLRPYRAPLRLFVHSDFYRLIAVAGVSWTTVATIKGYTGLSTSSSLISVAVFFSCVFMCLPRALRMLGGFAHLLSSRKKTTTDLNGSVSTVISGVNRQSLALSRFLAASFPAARLHGFVGATSGATGREIAGLPVIGAIADIESVHTAYAVDQLWVCGPHAEDDLSRLRQWGERAGVSVTVLESVDAFAQLRGHTLTSTRPNSPPSPPRPADIPGSNSTDKTIATPQPLSTSEDAISDTTV